MIDKMRDIPQCPSMMPWSHGWWSAYDQYERHYAWEWSLTLMTLWLSSMNGEITTTSSQTHVAQLQSNRHCQWCRSNSYHGYICAFLCGLFLTTALGAYHEYYNFFDIWCQKLNVSVQFLDPLQKTSVRSNECYSCNMRLSRQPSCSFRYLPLASDY